MISLIFIHWLTSAGVLCLFAYLVYALLRPEQF